jgi:hypothetical protein
LTIRPADVLAPIDGRTQARHVADAITPGLSPRAFSLVLASVIALGALVRASYLVATDFPLNDGGLFYAMVRDLQANLFRLPELTSYNGAHLPYAYSPLGFYIAGVIDALTPFSLFDLFRLLPFTYTVAAIAAFALLARRLLQSQIAVIAAVVAFALIPRSFVWLLMGGGVTRGLGFVFALLALHEVHRLYTERERRFLVTAALLSAGTVLTHIETGWFLAFSTALFWVAYGRTRESFTHSLSLAGVTGALALPWLLAVVARHGLDPMMHAYASGGNVFTSADLARTATRALAQITATSEPFFPILGALGLFGVLPALRAKHYVLPVWWVAIILLELRAYQTFTGVPVALLAGLAVAHIVLPLSRQVWERPLAAPSRGFDTLANPWRSVSRGTAVVTVGLLLYATVGALLRGPSIPSETHVLTSLTQDQRTALRWIDENTPPWSSFLVVPHGPWGLNKESEWFPVLAGRRSVATVQGLEWSPDYESAIEAYDAAWDCGYKTVDCLQRWPLVSGHSFTHIYITTTGEHQCCSTLIESLRRSANYFVIYDGPGGTVFVHNAAGAVLAAERSHYFAPPLPRRSNSRPTSTMCAGLTAAF